MGLLVALAASDWNAARLDLRRDQSGFGSRVAAWLRLSSTIRTEQCCETTARVASDLGLAVTFVADATATHPHAAWDGGTITSAEIRRATASALEGREFATVVTLEQALAAHPAR